MVSLEFFIDITLPAALRYGPEGDSASNRNEYKEHFLGGRGGGKGGRYVQLKPHYLHVLIVLKSGSLNLLKDSGPVQACNGNALIASTVCRFLSTR
jgi:hypothetical protein